MRRSQLQHTFSDRRLCHHDHEHDHSAYTPQQRDALHTHRSPAETRKLLEYMIVHNEQHADELADLLDGLPAQAQKKLLLAVGSFEAGNVQLREVLEALEE